MNSEASISPSRAAWLRFKKNKLAMAGLLFILALALVAILAPFIRPDGSPQTNAQQITLSNKSPGYSTQILRVHKNGFEKYSFFETIAAYGAPSAFNEYPFTSLRCTTDSVFIEDSRSGTAHQFLLDDVLADMDQLQNGDYRFGSKPENADVAEDIIYERSVKKKTFWLGTDKFGRDLLSRLMSGILISLSVGLIAVAISLLIGVTLGAAAGYFGGWADRVILWLINVIWSIPTLLLVLAMVFAFGKGFEKVFIAVGLTMWVEVARVVRGQMLSLRQMEYAQAAKVLGYSHRRILFKHLLPNAWGPVIVVSAANFAAAILIEAGLSFLGIGAQIPTPSWGNMIKEHYAYITTDLAYLAFIPGIMIMCLVLAFMLVGNGLRDAFDVRTTS